jgi:hypothetical protein
MLYVKDSGNSVGGTVKAATFVSDVADPADVGSIRLGDNQTISWENNPAGADVSVYASAGSIKVNGNFTLGECAAEKYIVWPCMGAMISVADAKFKFLNNLGTQGAMLDAATDGNVSLRNLADSAYATLKASTTTVVVGTKGATSVVGGAEQDLTCAGGGSATLVTSGLIPDGALLDGITTRITTALTGSTGYSVGDGSDPDMFGVAATATQDTVTTPASATASWSRLMLAAGEVTITFAGGNCTAGVVRVVAHYTTLGAPTSN